MLAQSGNVQCIADKGAVDPEVNYSSDSISREEDVGEKADADTDADADAEEEDADEKGVNKSSYRNDLAAGGIYSISDDKVEEVNPDVESKRSDDDKRKPADGKPNDEEESVNEELNQKKEELEALVNQIGAEDSEANKADEKKDEKDAESADKEDSKKIAARLEGDYAKDRITQLSLSIASDLGYSIRHTSAMR